MTLREQLTTRRHSALLIALIAAFAARPVIGDNGSAPVVFSLALLCLMLVALYAVQVDELAGERRQLRVKQRRWHVVGWTLAALAVFERGAMTMTPARSFHIFGATGWFLFMAYVTWIELRGVLRQKVVTQETISMSISVYLLMGMTWGLFYAILFELQPHAFAFGTQDVASIALMDANHELFPTFIYFSLTTLSTIGYGDITPVTLQARFAAVAEGITGQLYLAILVARLVGMQMSSLPARDR